MSEYFWNILEKYQFKKNIVIRSLFDFSTGLFQTYTGFIPKVY